MFNKLKLRTQLLLSHLFLLAVSLMVIAVTLFLFASTRPAPPEATYQRMAIILQNLTTRDVVRDALPNWRDNRNDDVVVSALFEEAITPVVEANQVRVVLILQRDEQFVTLYDSDGEFDPQATTIDIDQSFRDERLQLVQRDTEQIYGMMRDPDGDEWLFGGLVRRTTIRPNTPTTITTLLVAEPRPTVTLTQSLGDFSRSLLPPIIRAGIVGFIVAVVMALLISRSVARPLQALSEAANAVAKGDFGMVTPKTGPQEVQALAHTFDQMNNDVQTMQQSQRDFLANVSHDLKTPLTSIQGYSQAIMDGVAKDPAKVAQIIHDEAGRLNRMVIELTDLARMQSGRLSLKMTALDIGEIAASIGQRLSVVARKKNIELHIETGPMPQIAGDGDRLVQVFTNLLSNAIKYTPSGGSVWLTTSVHEGGVQVVVRDTGIGIPKRDLPRIFERFYQVDKARGPQRGTGLGLAITAEIVQAHGGTIHVYSEGENQGTTFTIWLPSPQLSTIMTRRPR